MCVMMMDTDSKHTKIDYRIKDAKHASKLSWRPPSVSTEEDEALKQSGAGAVRSTIRKYLRRQTKRAQLAKVTRGLGVVCNRRHLMAGVHRHPGEMAPENTTQYLMNNVYDDMKIQVPAVPVFYAPPSAQLYGEPMSPNSVYAALDSDYESSLVFQQRDFEEMFYLPC